MCIRDRPGTCRSGRDPRRPEGFNFPDSGSAAPVACALFYRKELHAVLAPVRTGAGCATGRRLAARPLPEPWARTVAGADAHEGWNPYLVHIHFAPQRADSVDRE